MPIKSREKKFNKLLLIMALFTGGILCAYALLQGKPYDQYLICQLDELNVSALSDEQKKIAAIKIYADAIRTNAGEEVIVACAETFDTLLPITHAGLAWAKLFNEHPDNTYYFFRYIHYKLMMGGNDESLAGIRLCVLMEPDNPAFREALAHWSYVYEPSEPISHIELAEKALEIARKSKNCNVNEMEKRLSYIFSNPSKADQEYHKEAITE